MNTYSGIEYLCIDIANSFGLDKELFETRIQWVKDNFNNLEELADQATEDKTLYIKSVRILRDVVAGKPTGGLISLDSTCSGLQILSALTGCINGARITNLTGENKRYDAYTEITDTQNAMLKRLVNGEVDAVSRKDAKQAVMTSLYGSEATPREIFGEGTLALEAFHEACFNQAPGAFGLLHTMKKAWQPFALGHYWKLPDGFDCSIKVMDSKEVRIEVDELNHHKFKTSYKENVGLRSGISLAANITHSVDAYVLRTLIRRCNYLPKQVNRVLSLIQDNMNARVTRNDSELCNLVHLQACAGMVDVSIIQYVNQNNVTDLPKDLRRGLVRILTKMLESKPFPILTVHDAFRIHANNGDTLRYWYKEILAELAESNLINHILSMITGKNIRLPKLSTNLPKLIRESNYGIC